MQLSGVLAGRFKYNMKDHRVEWNAANREWFCVRCLCISEGSSRQDAQRELSEFDCVPHSPSSSLNDQMKCRSVSLSEKLKFLALELILLS